MLRRSPFVALCVLSCAFFVLVVSASAAPVSNKPALEELLERAAEYMVRFVDRFSNVIAEEQYVQDSAIERLQIVTDVLATVVREHRELKSDFLLVTAPGSSDPVPFRDVFLIDRLAVDANTRDRRLAKLFVEAPYSLSVLEEAKAISEESARYNIGIKQRTINNPILGLTFLQRVNQPRFHFTLSKPDRTVGEHVWIVEYQETTSPTLIRGELDRSLPVHGRVWVDEATGRIAKTELKLNDVSVAASVTVLFRYDERFQIDLPIDMSERYRLSNARLEGHATYDRFRAFVEPNTAERIADDP